MINDMIEQGLVLLDAEGVATAEEAIRCCGGLLVGAGRVTEEYVDDMVDSYRTLGPYFVMAPGIALPHARPSGHVGKNSLCFVRLKDPVVFGHPENDPVRLLFGLAGTGQDQHLELIQMLGNILAGEENLQALYRVADYESFSRLLSRAAGVERGGER